MSVEGIDALPLLLKAHQDAADAQKKTIGLLEHRIMELESSFQRQANQNQQLVAAIQQMRLQQAATPAEPVEELPPVENVEDNIE